jgi:ketosteroid isomerase-like protein
MRAKWIVVPMALWLALCLAGPSHGAEAGAESRDAIEQEVRRLDAQEADAVLRGDLAALDALWAEDFIVNNPMNTVTFGRRGPVGTGALTYASFERVAEVVALRGDVALVMGHEVVVPKAPSANAGRTLHRRYTNVWMKTARGWRLAARHANVIAGATTNAP